jgi:hypothetical protein
MSAVIFASTALQFLLAVSPMDLTLRLRLRSARHDLSYASFSSILGIPGADRQIRELFGESL